MWPQKKKLIKKTDLTVCTVSRKKLGLEVSVLRGCNGDGGARATTDSCSCITATAAAATVGGGRPVLSRPRVREGAEDEASAPSASLRDLPSAAAAATAAAPLCGG